ncbi:MAG: helix-turn-helix transcriptional regulator [Bacteroidales bacterium]|nr:helix-turn-helix transcriptional regulator [Bacteroidales bacterium]
MNDGINSTILSLIDKTPASILSALASRVKQRRLELNWTQKFVASKAGMPLATYRRFESKGEVSLRGLVMIAIALGAEDDLSTLFARQNYQSMDDLVNKKAESQRKRGSKNG